MEQKLQNNAYPIFSTSERFKIGAFFLCVFIECVLLGIFVSFFGDIWPLNLLVEAIEAYSSWGFLILTSLLISSALSCAAAFTRFFAEPGIPAFAGMTILDSNQPIQSNPSGSEPNPIHAKQLSKTTEHQYPKKSQGQQIPKKQAVDLPLDIYRLLTKHLSYRDLSCLIRTTQSLYNDDFIAEIMRSRIQIQIVLKKFATYVLFSVDDKSALYMSGQHTKHDMFMMEPQSSNHFVKIDQPDAIQRIFDTGDTLSYLCAKGTLLRTIKGKHHSQDENENDIKFEGIADEVGENLVGDPVSGASTFILTSIQGTQEKILYASGANKFGELGLGDSEPKDKFETVQLPQPAHLIRQIMSAHDITLLVYPNNVYICGKNFSDTFKPLLDFQVKNIDSVTIQEFLIWIVTTNDQNEKELWAIHTPAYVNMYLNIQENGSWHYQDILNNIDIIIPLDSVKLQFPKDYEDYTRKIREKQTHTIEKYSEFQSGLAKILQKIDGFRHRIYNCTANLKQALQSHCKELETVKIINIYCSETEGIYVAAEFQKNSGKEHCFFRFKSQEYPISARYLLTNSYEYFPFKNYLDKEIPIESIQGLTFFGYTPIEYKDALVLVTTPEKKQVLCSRDHNPYRNPSQNFFKPVFYVPQNYQLLDIITNSESKSTFLALQSRHGKIKLYGSGYDSSKVGLGRKSVSSFTEIPNFIGNSTRNSRCGIQ